MIGRIFKVKQNNRKKKNMKIITWKKSKELIKNYFYGKVPNWYGGQPLIPCFLFFFLKNPLKCVIYSVHTNVLYPSLRTPNILPVDGNLLVTKLFKYIDPYTNFIKYRECASAVITGNKYSNPVHPNW